MSPLSSSSPLSPLLSIAVRYLLRIRSEVLLLATLFCCCVPEPWFAYILRNILPVSFIESILPEELQLRVTVVTVSKMFLLSTVFIESILTGKLQPMVKLCVDSLSSTSAASKRFLQRFLQRDNFSTEIENIVPEKLPPMVKLWVDNLSSKSAASKRSAAAKLRLLAKHRDDWRVLIADSGAIPGLVLLLKSTDRRTQEHAVTALLNLSLCRRNKQPIAETLDAIESIIHVLNTGTETSKQNAAAALSSLAKDNKETSLTIGAHGAVLPLVALLIQGSLQGKKDALMALYTLCLEERNNQRAVIAVGPLVGLVAEQGSGVAEKAMMVLRSLARIRVGRTEIVENGGIPALVKAIDESSLNGKELAVFTLLQLCKNSVENRELMVAAGGIRALVKAIDESSLIGKELVVMTLLQLCESVENRGLVVAEGGIRRLEVLSRIGTEAETLLGYLTEARNQEVASSSSP